MKPDNTPIRPQTAHHKSAGGAVMRAETGTKTGPFGIQIHARNSQNRVPNEAEIDTIMMLGQWLDDGRAGPGLVLVVLQMLLQSIEKADDIQYQALRDACAQSVVLDDLRRSVDRLVIALDR